MASRTTPDWDARTVRRVRGLLRAEDQILDAGCGYGRIAVPLAAAGFAVAGVDICPPMLDEAAARAAAAGVGLPLVRGDLTELPFADARFDVVLCLWLTFHELLKPCEQIAALREMARVLRPGGWALLDGPPFLEDEAGLATAAAPPPTEDVTPETFGSVNRAPPNDAVAAAYAPLLAAAEISGWTLFVDDCPGRPRYFLRFWKSPEA